MFLKEWRTIDEGLAYWRYSYSSGRESDQTVNLSWIFLRRICKMKEHCERFHRRRILSPLSIIFAAFVRSYDDPSSIELYTSYAGEFASEKEPGEDGNSIWTSSVVHAIRRATTYVRYSCVRMHVSLCYICMCTYARYVILATLAEAGRRNEHRER